MGVGRKRLKGAAALSIVALASAMGAAGASADGHEVCVNCVIVGPPLVTSGRENAFLKIQGANGNAIEAFSKYRTGNSFNKDTPFDKHGPENAFHKIENNPGQAFIKIGDNAAFFK